MRHENQQQSEEAAAAEAAAAEQQGGTEGADQAQETKPADVGEVGN